MKTRIELNSLSSNGLEEAVLSPNLSKWKRFTIRHLWVLFSPNLNVSLDLRAQLLSYYWAFYLLNNLNSSLFSLVKSNGGIFNCLSVAPASIGTFDDCFIFKFYWNVTENRGTGFKLVWVSTSKTLVSNVRDQNWEAEFFRQCNLQFMLMLVQF